MSRWAAVGGRAYSGRPSGQPPRLIRRGRISTEEPPLPAGTVAIIGICVFFVLLGLGWPAAADTLLRLFVVLFAIVYVGTFAYRMIQPLPRVEDVKSPFGSDPPPPRRRAAAPEGLLHLSVSVNAVNQEQTAKNTKIPLPIQLTLCREASRKLTERHGLSLREPLDHVRIRSLLSEPTWNLISPIERPRLGIHPTAPIPPVPMSQLERILDDLEKL